MGSTTILRGFKVSVAVLDAFLRANGVDETYGAPPFYRDHPDKDPISALLYTKVNKTDGNANKHDFRVIIPEREGYDTSNVAYITHSWAAVFAHRELQLDEDLPTAVSPGFLALRKEVLSFSDSVAGGENIPDEGRMGLFVVCTDGFSGWFQPKGLLERAKLPQRCDQCDAVFNDLHQAFYKKQEHRIQAHGSKEGLNPLLSA